jgi:uncharacterized membrane protein SpoIIM required for sporulation
MASAGHFLTRWFFVLNKRGLLVTMLNLVYFGALIVGGFLAQYTSLFQPVVVGNDVFGVSGASVWLVFDIFVSNLFLSAFLLLTLSGVVFFVFPLAVLVYRGILWGVLLNLVSTDRFFMVLPTIILEGEGYVIAAVAGVILGLSWLWPRLIYLGEDLTRKSAFKKAIGEAASLLIVVVILLFVAAIVETVTITFLSS